ncbi:MAG: threonylcarbamoyl-AMP synthase [Bacilli bacterium]|jgi:L-threonylcarbamoyladenylate synthase|nr:threonylcarbamoyl-AMP synthase [Bacilli bacterium]
MNTLLLEFNDTLEARKIILNDGVIAFPTETVYGLGCRYDSFLAYNKIFEVKGRDASKSLTVMLYDKNDISKLAKVNEGTKKVIDKFMPGALTLVLPLNDDVKIIGCQDTVGIRIPDNEDVLNLLKGIEKYMFVTSANLSNHDSLSNFDDVYHVFNNKIDGIVKGEISNGEASTVCSIVDDTITIFRQGPISKDEIEGAYYEK